jgi:tRNA threonylcarbamoyladenosine biosynthesis protein TsaE
VLTLEVGSAQAQEALGRAMAAACPASCVIYLEGELGAGKTTLVRGFLRGLGHQGAVKSPTYTLLEPYELPARRCFHFDLYRLADPGELEYLGVRDLLQGEAILLVEWPERGQGELPAPDLRVRIHYQPAGRHIELAPLTAQGEQLLDTLEFSP